MKIAILRHGQLLTELESGESSIITIGRDAASTLKIDEQQLSRKHLEIGVGSEGLYIKDPGSTNGTFLNGVRIPAHKTISVKASDKIMLTQNAGIRIVVGEEELRDWQEEEEKTIVKKETPPVAIATKNDDRLWGILYNGDEFIIGRSNAANLNLAHPTVSRRHASLKKINEQTYLLTDLGSTNGTFLNGKKLTEPTEVNSSDNILIGRFRVRIGQLVKDLSAEMAVKASGIAKVYGNGKFGLQVTSFQVRSKSLMAIMGPSGCGKSTLLKALNGDAPATQGTIHLCGL